MKIYFIFISLLFTLNVQAHDIIEPREREQIDLKENCQDGLIKAPKGVFDVFVLCNEGHPTISILHRDYANNSFESWKDKGPYWQGIWGDNVKIFSWASSENTLIVVRGIQEGCLTVRPYSIRLDKREVTPPSKEIVIGCGNND